MLALITGALQGLASLPKLFEQIAGLIASIQQMQKIAELQAKLDQMHEALDNLKKATTDDEKLQAIKILAASTNA